jgi:FAD/FMN-containing dehydrogenase
MTDAPSIGLEADFTGELLRQDDPGYEDARAIFNAMVDRRPALIAQCDTREDVISALAFARSRGLEVAVRGGGHSVAGSGVCEGGLVIDLRRMNTVSVDPSARTAAAGGGATWGDFDRACAEHGLVTTGGRVSTTGVAGLTLGGGSGWLERKLGLACDSLTSVELITADGGVVTASEDENSELFWALHGGGGNFGIATELTFRLHPLPHATLALLLWPPDAAADVIRGYRNLMADAPDELGGGAFFLTGPPEEFVPQHLVGQRALGVAIVFCGDEPSTRDAITPLLELSPDGEMIAELPYPDIQSAMDDPPGMRNYWSAEHLTDLPDAAIAAFCARAQQMIVPSLSQYVLLPWGGEVTRQADRWPLPHRHAAWVVHPFGVWEDPADDARGIDWVKAARGDMQPFATGDVYLNFTGTEGRDRIIAGFGADNYRRLANVKAEYDPTNIFHINHNIAPASA